MKNKKILILGGTGALGKTLIKRYYKNNEIIVFSRDEYMQLNEGDPEADELYNKWLKSLPFQNNLILNKVFLNIYLFYKA